MEPLTTTEARRLALARAGLLNPAWTGLPARARGRGKRAREASCAVIRRFGYLQLDSVSVAGARSHALVLLSRLAGLDPALPEELLRPGAPLFEYWGHEASWLPLELYPVFAFRRREFRAHPWWGDLIGEHPQVARRLLERIHEEGPLRSTDLEGASRSGWWNLKLAKKVASALWSRGDLAIRERRGFQKVYDLAERVIPGDLLAREVPEGEALGVLLLQALAGHGWARTGTLVNTWRLRNRGRQIGRILDELAEAGKIARCDLLARDGRRLAGWIRPEDRELAARLRRVRPRPDRGVLLSPFDPVLWDRARVADLFGFEQVLEIFKPAGQRIYGYYCLPVLAGDRLVARADLKADRRAGRLHVLALHREDAGGGSTREAAARQATESALARYAGALELEVTA